MQTVLEYIDSTHFAVGTLVDLLQQRRYSEQKGFLFLNGNEPDRLTFQVLDQRARAIAVHLQSLMQPGERVLLLYPPSLEYICAFFGCLYAGVIAVPAYPPKRNRSGERLQSIAEDATAVAVLTTAAVCNTIERTEALPKIPVSHWIISESINLTLAQQWQTPLITPETLAFLQYTSGSTGKPKGVMVSHDNLIQNLQLINYAFDANPDSVNVSWLPPYHDMGLIGGILAPLYANRPTILMSPVDFLRQPFAWLKAISDYGGTISGAPNFAYDLCVQKVTAQQRSTLDLSRWMIAFNGAEPIRAKTLERFSETFAECGFRRESFYPCYGMAESTLLVTSSNPGLMPYQLTVEANSLAQNRITPLPLDQNGSTENLKYLSLVSCGHPWLNTKLFIVDPEQLTLCPDGTVGEIWTASSSVAQGYWNQPELSEQAFRAVLRDGNEETFLRTGDLGCLKDGELYVTGRLKDVIIIRGQNHYPQDIEQTLEQSHPMLRPSASAAFVVEMNGEEKLVVVAELERRYRQQTQKLENQQPPIDRRLIEVIPKYDIDAETLPLQIQTIIEDIRAAIAHEHGLQAYKVVLIKPGTLPKTSSGKIQRYACRNHFLMGTLSVIEV